jgi:hypothetical protein
MKNLEARGTRIEALEKPMRQGSIPPSSLAPLDGKRTYKPGASLLGGDEARGRPKQNEKLKRRGRAHGAQRSSSRSSESACDSATIQHDPILDPYGNFRN